jgi:tRNA(Ile2) C34 agmatinyltransferase TiaS
MNEKQEIRLLLFIITLGIFLLFFMNMLVDTPILTINETVNQKLESKVKTIGEIETITHSENLTIINIKDDTGKIKIIFFEETKQLSKQDIIIVEGILIEYREEFEIEAMEIIKILEV